MFFDIDGGVAPEDMKKILSEIYTVIKSTVKKTSIINAVILKNTKKDNWHIVFPWLISDSDYFKNFADVNGLDLECSQRGTLRMPYQLNKNESGVYDFYAITNYAMRFVDDDCIKSLINFEFDDPNPVFTSTERVPQILRAVIKDGQGLLHLNSLHFLLEGSEDVSKHVKVVKAVKVSMGKFDLLEIEVADKGDDILAHALYMMTKFRNNYDIRDFSTLAVVDEFKRLTKNSKNPMSDEIRHYQALAVNKFCIRCHNGVWVSIDDELQQFALHEAVTLFDCYRIPYKAGNKIHFLNFIESWNKCSQRNSADRMVFDPKFVGHREELMIYNSFQGLPHYGTADDPFAPLKSMFNSVEAKKVAKHMNYHVFEYVCDGKMDKFYFLMMCVAVKMRRPWLKLNSCVILQGNEGCGKGCFTQWVKAGFGQYAHTVQDLAGVLESRFNSEFENKLFIQVDEAFLKAGKIFNKFKNIITDETIMIEKKGTDKTKSTNYMWFVLNTNAIDILPPGDTARRFALYKCKRLARSDDDKKYDDHFRPLMHAFADDNQVAVKCWLAQFVKKDIISDADLNAFGKGESLPLSCLEALVNQRKYHFNPVYQFWSHCLSETKTYNGLTDFIVNDMGKRHLQGLDKNELELLSKYAEGTTIEDLDSQLTDREMAYNDSDGTRLHHWLQYQSIELLYNYFKSLQKQGIVSGMNDRFGVTNVDRFVIRSEELFPRLKSQKLTLRFDDSSVYMARNRCNTLVADQTWESHVRNPRHRGTHTKIYWNIGPHCAMSAHFNKLINTNVSGDKDASQSWSDNKVIMGERILHCFGRVDEPVADPAVEPDSQDPDSIDFFSEEEEPLIMKRRTNPPVDPTPRKKFKVTEKGYAVLEDSTDDDPIIDDFSDVEDFCLSQDDIFLNK